MAYLQQHSDCQKEIEMDCADHRKLIARLELDYSLSPRLFLGRTLLLAVAGHLIPLLMLLLPLAGLVYGFALTRDESPLLGGFLILILAPSLFFLVRFLLAPVAPPIGTVLAATQAPRLFRLVQKLQARIPGPKLHSIVIDDQCRVCVEIVPQLGALGGDHYYLVIGLPYLQALSPNQFAAMLGREERAPAVVHDAADRPRQLRPEGLPHVVRGDGDELSKMIEKKRAKYPDEQKLIAYLARQGFSYDDIKSALHGD